jgi:hypothetical protein
MKRFQRKRNQTEGLAIVILLLVFLFAPSISSVAQAVTNWISATFHTSYYHQTEGNTVVNELLTGVKQTTAELQNWSDTGGVPVINPRLTFTTTLPVSWTNAHLQDNGLYKWNFPDIPEGDEAPPAHMKFDPSLISVDFNPGFFASRIISPSALAAPGGTQTVTVTIIPKESALNSYPAARVNVYVRFDEDENVIPTVVSATKSGDEDIDYKYLKFDDQWAFWTFGPWTVDDTYTLDITVDVVLREGTEAVEYKPYIMIHLEFEGESIEVPGTSATFNTIFDSSIGTWSWQADNEHLWKLHEIIEQGVEFLTVSRHTSLEQTLLETTEIIDNLDDSVFKSENRGKTLINKINDVEKMIDKGDYQEALNKLKHDILKKTDGCAEIGASDQNDWIVNCETQGQVYPLIMGAIELLTHL